MDGPEQLFETYRSGGLSYLGTLIGNESESEILDFKTFSSTNPRNWNESDKKSLSEALSGFANSEGGLIVWGVDCRQVDGVDVAQELKPLQNVSIVHSQMKTLCAGLVSPAVPGVDSFPIFRDELTDIGFIVLLIPRNESTAHMAMSGHKFMYRGGAAFHPMPQWMVADRMGRRPQPKLRLVSSLVQPFCKLSITNDGLGMARFPAYDLKRGKNFNPAKMITDDASKNIITQRTSEKASGQANANIVILPRRSLEIGILELGINDLEIEYELFCDGFYVKDKLEIKA